MNEAKPFVVEKRVVMESWLQVKANRGSAGIDGIDLKSYESNLQKNLYKLWNRMSSGSYFPKAVKLVEIPKPNGGKRPLGIPTVEDRVAQMVVVMYIAPRLEAIFHDDSYGYRPMRSAHSAIAKAIERCNENLWVLDMDISKFFDTIDHGLLMKAVQNLIRQDGKVLVSTDLSIRLVSGDGEKVWAEESLKRVRLIKSEKAGVKQRAGLNITKCPYCGASIDLTERKCSYCGTPFLYERPLNIDSVT